MSLHARGRHRRRSTRSTTLAVTGVASALAVGGALGLAGPASAATGDAFAQLRQCESGGDYTIDTGNGYYGAYQFNLATWHGLGYSGMPSDASPATQDAAARELAAQRGWEPWPACSRKLGLTGATVVEAAVPHVETAAARSTERSGVAPPYGGTLLTTRYVDTFRSDVQTWQARMAELGATIAVDGYYGPQTRGVAVAFQRQQGLLVDGIVGPVTWAAAWAG